MTAIRTDIARAPSRWPLWPVAVALLVLGFQLYPAVMDFPPFAQAAASATPAETPQDGAMGTCPPGDHCAEVAVEQALPRLPAPPLLLLALVVIGFAMRWQPRPPATRRDWWWPPDRRRALLQVFLI